jgi:hypothetical protein
MTPSNSTRDDDPADRPPPEIPSPADDVSPSTMPKPETTKVRGARSWFGDLTKATFVVQVVGVVVAVISLAVIIVPLVLNSGSGAPPAVKTSSEAASTKPSPQSSGTEAPAPLISSEATCAEVTDTAAGDYGRRVLIDSPGKIGGGANDVRSRVLPGEEFSTVSRVVAGDEVEVKALLHNGNYTAADGVSVAASISTYQGKCWRVTERVRVQSYPEDTPRLGPALILLEHGGQATLEYVPGSTQLMEEQGNPLATDLADGVTQGGIRLPYAVPGGAAYFLSFRVRVRPSSGPVSPSP